MIVSRNIREKIYCKALTTIKETNNLINKNIKQNGLTRDQIFTTKQKLKKN